MLKTIANIQNANKIGVVIKAFSVSSTLNEQYHSKVLVIGGGAGGCSVAAKFVNGLGKDNVTIIEPSDKHYYQPLFTLAGGGLKTVAQAEKNMGDVLPNGAKWIKDSVAEFDPKNNTVTTARGDVVTYDILLVAVGLETRYQDIPGLLQALENYDNVGSIYSPKYAEQAFRAIRKFDKGDVVYTYPNSPVKCPGAPQKICYIHEHFLQKNGKRSNAKVTYNTSLPVIFGVKQYADALWKVAKSRNINVNLRTCLVEVHPQKNEAIFQNLDKPDEKFAVKYSVLHAVPPMGTPNALKANKDIANNMGFLTVDKLTLQHTKYPNIFGIGDCTDSPNSKTAAAVAAQCRIVYRHMRATLEGKPLTYAYDGYASCPLVTGAGKCILAEFDYSLQPLETFPIRQDREMYIMYLFKKELMPFLYWNLMLKGYWNGPAIVRKMLHLGLSK
ncbi:hypothetical protein Trydic_g18273 [Trypoxylus dichotomus]